MPAGGPSGSGEGDLHFCPTIRDVPKVDLTAHRLDDFPRVGQTQPQTLVRSRVEGVEGTAKGFLRKSFSAVANRDHRPSTFAGHGEIHRAASAETCRVVKDQVEGVEQGRSVHGSVKIRTGKHEANPNLVISGKVPRYRPHQSDHILPFTVLLDLLDEEVEILKRAESPIDPLAQLRGIGFGRRPVERLTHRPSEVGAHTHHRLAHGSLSFDFTRSPAH